MSALPIRKTGTEQPLAVSTNAPKTKLKIRKGEDPDTTPSVSLEAHAKANFPDNPRAQELEVKLRKRIATHDEIAELREITLRDSNRLTDILCWRMIDGIFKSKQNK